MLYILFRANVSQTLFNFLNNLIFTDNKKTRAKSILELSNNTQEKINKIFKIYINQVRDLDFEEQFITD